MSQFAWVDEQSQTDLWIRKLLRTASQFAVRQPPFLCFPYSGIWLTALSEKPNSPAPLTDMNRHRFHGPCPFLLLQLTSPPCLTLYLNTIMVLLLLSQFSIKIFHEGQKAPRWTQLFPGSAPLYGLKRKDPVEVKAKEHSRARNQAAITNRCVLCTKYKACRLDDPLPFILSDPNV